MSKKGWRRAFGSARGAAPATEVSRPVSAGTLGAQVAPFVPAHPLHRGNPVRVGPHTIFAGGTRDLRSEDLIGYDAIIPLTSGSLPLPRRQRTVVLPYEMADYGGVPADWAEFLQEVIAELQKGSKILAFCMGSHGRTGCFLASLVSLVETETADPIAAVRARHCRKAVESEAQAAAVFALRGQPLPEQYRNEFYRPPLVTAPAGHTVWPSAHGGPRLPADRWWQE